MTRNGSPKAPVHPCLTSPDHGLPGPARPELAMPRLTEPWTVNDLVRGSARQGSAWTGGASQAWVWLGVVGQSKVWRGAVCQARVGRAEVSAWHGKGFTDFGGNIFGRGLARFGRAWLAAVRTGEVRYGLASQAGAWFGMAWVSRCFTFSGEARRGVAGRAVAGLGVARRASVWSGGVRYGVVR